MIISRLLICSPSHCQQRPSPFGRIPTLVPARFLPPRWPARSINTITAGTGDWPPVSSDLKMTDGDSSPARLRARTAAARLRNMRLTAPTPAPLLRWHRASGGSLMRRWPAFSPWLLCAPGFCVGGRHDARRLHRDRARPVCTLELDAGTDRDAWVTACDGRQGRRAGLRRLPQLERDRGQLQERGRMPICLAASRPAASARVRCSMLRAPLAGLIATRAAAKRPAIAPGTTEAARGKQAPAARPECRVGRLRRPVTIRPPIHHQ
jgi:hypothetical protein